MPAMQATTQVTIDVFNHFIATSTWFDFVVFVVR